MFCRSLADRSTGNSIIDFVFTYCLYIYYIFFSKFFCLFILFLLFREVFTPDACLSTSKKTIFCQKCFSRRFGKRKCWKQKYNFIRGVVAQKPCFPLQLLSCSSYIYNKASKSNSYEIKETMNFLNHRYISWMFSPAMGLYFVQISTENLIVFHCAICFLDALLHFKIPFFLFASCNILGVWHLYILMIYSCTREWSF